MQIYEIIALVFLGVVAIGIMAYLFINQRSKIVDWLKYACMEAEKLLGTKTGQAKLHTVYGWFCKQFPKLASVMPFSWFSALVDVALGTFKEWYSKNENVNAYVKGDENGIIYK